MPTISLSLCFLNIKLFSYKPLFSGYSSFLRNFICLEIAEKESLAGVGAQYDSEVVYHSMKEELIKQGVIYTDMETAVREYEDIVKEHFMKCVPIYDHKFVALHGAVWSGGSFVYVRIVHFQENLI